MAGQEAVSAWIVLPSEETMGEGGNSAGMGLSSMLASAATMAWWLAEIGGDSGWRGGSAGESRE